jgi:hypothetical protein
MDYIGGSEIMECSMQHLGLFSEIGDSLTMDYFDNLDNGSLNKYKKI